MRDEIRSVLRLMPLRRKYVAAAVSRESGLGGGNTYEGPDHREFAVFPRPGVSGADTDDPAAHPDCYVLRILLIDAVSK